MKKVRLPPPAWNRRRFCGSVLSVISTVFFVTPTSRHKLELSELEAINLDKEYVIVSGWVLTRQDVGS